MSDEVVAEQKASVSPEVKDSEHDIDLTLLLVSGKRKSFSFPKTTTIAQVKQFVYNNWPKGTNCYYLAIDWDDETYPASHEALKILYLGRFLEENSTLEGTDLR